MEVAGDLTNSITLFPFLAPYFVPLFQKGHVTGFFKGHILLRDRHALTRRGRICCLVTDINTYIVLCNTLVDHCYNHAKSYSV